MRLRATSSSFLLLLAGSLLAACNLDNRGDEPPRALIYLPTGLMLSAATADTPARYLYVVNSNFDLRYNAGSLQAYDLDRLDAAITRCAERARLGASRCEIEPSDMLAGEVLVPSLATYIAPSSDYNRLYVATRTSTELSSIDVREGSDSVLSCGRGRECDERHTHYIDPLASERRLSVPREPVGILAASAAQLIAGGDGPAGELVLIAHRGGQLSLLLDDGSSELQLQDVLTIGTSARPVKEPTSLTFDPSTGFIYLTIFARDSRELADKKILARAGVTSGGADSPAFLYDAGVVSLEGVSLGRDLRALALDPVVSGQALVVSHSPNSLLWVDVAAALSGQSPPTQVLVRKTTTVGRGPSRVVTGQLGGRTLAIVSCFDSRQIFVLDAVTGEPLSIVHNFSGPFELALDAVRRRLYVADFRSSVVRVLDLTPLVDGPSETIPGARVIATLGHPQLVQELQ